MNPTKYHRPAALDAAIRLFGESPDAAYLSGGHTLLPTMKQRLARPDDLIDLGAIAALKGIGLDGDTVWIGAGTVHAEVAASALVCERIPALAGLAGSIGDRHVRHRGTIGGSVANNDPAADYPAAVLGLGATIVTDRREIGADQFFVSLYETALEPGEIVTRLLFPIPDLAGYAKFRSYASRYAVTASFVSRRQREVRVAITGAGAQGVFRAADIERALATDFSAAAVADCRMDPANLMSDLSGSAAYRANLAIVLTRRALDNLGSAKSYK